MSFSNSYIFLLLAIAVAYGAASECSVNTIMECTKHLSTLGQIDGNFLDINSFSKSASKICNVLDMASECLAGCALPPSVRDGVSNPLEKQKEMCDLNTFMKKSPVYAKHQKCLNQTLTDAHTCIRDSYAELIGEGETLEKKCCALQNKMFCFEKKLPKNCDGETMSYDFVEDMRTRLHTECAKTLCSSANIQSLFLPAILPAISITVFFRRFF